MPRTHSTMRSSGIYQIRHIISGKIYIGSAVHFRHRWESHRSSLERGKHHNRHLQFAWTRDGAEAFVFQVMEIVPNPNSLPKLEFKPILHQAEQKHLDRFKPFDHEVIYNDCPIADSALGVKRTPEAVAKSSAARTGQKRTPEAKARMATAATGNTAHSGHTHSPEARAKMSKGMKGLARRLGTKHSLETRAKMSADRKGRRASPETKAKMSAARKGKPGPNKGGKLSPETRAKMSAAHKARQRRESAKPEQPKTQATLPFLDD